MRLMRLLALLLLPCVAGAQTYYEKTTIPPTGTAYSFPCNPSASTGAWLQCVTHRINATLTKTSSSLVAAQYSILDTSTLGGSPTATANTFAHWAGISDSMDSTGSPNASWSGIEGLELTMTGSSKGGRAVQFLHLIGATDLDSGGVSRFYQTQVEKVDPANEGGVSGATLGSWIVHNCNLTNPTGTYAQLINCSEDDVNNNDAGTRSVAGRTFVFNGNSPGTVDSIALTSAGGSSGFAAAGGLDALISDGDYTGYGSIAPSSLHTNLMGAIVGGSGYGNGTYTAVPLTGGSGSGAKATIVVSGGAVTTVTITTPGSAYKIGDSLSASNANLGGAGSGFTIAVTKTSGDFITCWQNAATAGLGTCTRTYSSFADLPNATFSNYIFNAQNWQVTGIGQESIAQVGTSAPAWTTRGIQFQTGTSGSPPTYTDTTSSGTVAIESLVTLNTANVNASSTTTITDLATLQIDAPTATGNVTCTRCDAILVRSGQTTLNGKLLVQSPFTQNSGAFVMSGGGNSAIDAGGTNTLTVQATSSGALILGNTGNNVNFVGTPRIQGSSSGVITLAPQAASGTYEWDWPTTAGNTGQFLTSAGGAGSAMTWGAVPLSGLATQATNTVVGNATSGSASPTALSVSSCSTSASALQWTTNTGFGCNTSINAGTLGGATFSAPGAIGGGTPAAGTFTTLTANTSASLTSATLVAGTNSAGTWPVIGSGTVLSAPVAGTLERDANGIYATIDNSNRGIVPITYFIRQHADRAAFANDTNQHPIFDSVTNGTITLPVGAYTYEALIQCKGMSATSGNVKWSLLGAGGATLANVLQFVTGVDGTNDSQAAVSASMLIAGTASTGTNVVAASTGTIVTLQATGSFEVTVTGTLIPSIAQTTATTTAVVTAGSYLRLVRVGAATVTSVGNWN